MNYMQTKLKIAAICTVFLVISAAVAVFSANQETEPDEKPQSLGGFSGIAVDAVSGMPIAAVISAQSEDSSPAVIANASENGAFELALPDGTYTIAAAAPGYVSQGRRDLGREVTIVKGAKFVNARMDLWPEAKITGRIVSETVGVKAHIIVKMRRDKSGAEDYRLFDGDSNSDGSFLADGLSPGTAEIQVAADGFASVELKNVELAVGNTVDLGDIPLRDGVALFGEITAEASKQGVPQAVVRLRDRKGRILAQTNADKNGMFRLPAVEFADVVFEALADGYYSSSKVLKLSGNANLRVDAALRRATGITLNILNLTERDPIQTSIVITDTSSSKVVYNQTLPNGRIVLSQLTGGPFLIAAASSDKLTEVTYRAAAGDDIMVRLKPFAKLLIHSRKSDGSEMQNGQYRLNFSGNSGESSDDDAWIAFDKASFEVADLHAGRYRIEMRENAHSRVASSPDFLLHDGDVREMTVQMTEGGVLQGHVVTAGNGVGVRAAVTIAGSNSRTVNTDRDGFFTIDKLPEEPFAIVIKPDREKNESRFEGIVVKPNDKLSRDFRVESERADRRAQHEEMRRIVRERIENGEQPWGDGPPPWGDGTPPWGDGTPPWGDGPPPSPPDGAPPWGDGEPPDGPPPWGDGEPPSPPDGPPPAPPDGSNHNPPAPPSGSNHNPPATPSGSNNNPPGTGVGKPPAG